MDVGVEVEVVVVGSWIVVTEHTMAPGPVTVASTDAPGAVVLVELTTAFAALRTAAGVLEDELEVDVFDVDVDVDPPATGAIVVSERQSGTVVLVVDVL